MLERVTLECTDMPPEDPPAVDARLRGHDVMPANAGIQSGDSREEVSARVPYRQRKSALGRRIRIERTRHARTDRLRQNHHRPRLRHRRVVDGDETTQISREAVQ